MNRDSGIFRKNFYRGQKHDTDNESTATYY